MFAAQTNNTVHIQHVEHIFTRYHSIAKYGFKTKRRGKVANILI